MKFVRSTLTRRRDIVNLLPNYNKVLDRTPLHVKVAEVGVFLGAFSRQIQEIRPNAKLHLIDPWNNPKCEGLMLGGEKEYQQVKDHLPNAEINRKTSQEAVSDYHDGSFDMVYLDAEHTYDGVLSDIALWWPKVKDGGILAGHDVFTPEHIGVTQALMDSFKHLVYVIPQEKCPFLDYYINPSWYVFKL